MYQLSKEFKDIIEKYVAENGHLEPKATELYNGFKLGMRIANLRTKYKNNELSDEFIVFLNNKDMVWDYYEKTFNLNIEEVKKYKEQNGHINVPSNYSQNGVSIGQFIRLVRKRYAKTVGRLDDKREYGVKVLTEEEIKILEDLGIEWRLDTAAKETFYKNLEIAKLYLEKFGHLRPHKKESFNGLLIGCWLQNLRHEYNHKNIPQYKIDEMNRLDMIWDVDTYDFYEKYVVLEKYYNEFGHVRVPQRVDIDDIPIGRWLNQLRMSYKKGTLPQWKIDAMDKLGMEWTDLKVVECTSFNEQVIYFYLKEYFKDIKNRYREFKKKNGNIFELDIYIPSLQLAVEYDGYLHHDKLKRDVDKNKRCKELGVDLIRVRESRLPVFPKEYLSIKLEKENTDCMEKSTIELINYINKKYGTSISINIDIRRDMYDILRLYNAVNSSSWDSKFEVCKRFFEEHGHLNVPNDLMVDGTSIKSWLYEQRYKNTGARGFITKQQVEMLSSIGLDWRPSEKIKEKWENMFLLCEEYANIYGNLDIPQSFIYKGEPIGKWLSRQKIKYNKPTVKTGKLSENQIVRFEALGINWNTRNKKASIV